MIRRKICLYAGADIIVKRAFFGFIRPIGARGGVAYNVTIGPNGHALTVDKGLEIRGIV